MNPAELQLLKTYLESALRELQNASPETPQSLVSFDVSRHVNGGWSVKVEFSRTFYWPSEGGQS